MMKAEQYSKEADFYIKHREENPFQLEGGKTYEAIGLIPEQLYKLMQDYAKQEAIEFGEWLEQNNRFNAPLSISQQYQKYDD